jgi:hypothetical protein
VEASPLTIALKRKLLDHDLLLAHTTSFEQQRGVASIGRLYRRRHLFFPSEAVPANISFIGGGAAWGETPNWAGEVGFVMLRSLVGDVYQAPWHGHIPVERHGDGLWCLLFGIRPSKLAAESSDVLRNTKASRRRFDKEGQSFDTWIRFEFLEEWLMKLIGAIDDSPCVPIDVGSTEDWLSRLQISAEF